MSTDELYYAGKCDRCERAYTVESRSRAWATFVQRAHAFLAARDRRMILWLEYPLLPKHVSLLPPDVIDGVLGNGYFHGMDPPRLSSEVRRAYLEAEREHGISGLLYTSVQGAELLFPNYFSTEGNPGRLATTFATLSAERPPHAIGTFGAAWDDAGLHNETFWLGWSAVAQYGWSRQQPSVAAHAAAFFDAYYGPEVTGMAALYQGLQQQARFFETSWDAVEDTSLKPSYGTSRGKDPHPRTSRRLPPPALPALPDLDVTRVYDGAYAERVAKARRKATQNTLLTHRLEENLLRATRNRYNLEVLLSLAAFTGHHNRLLIGLKAIEDHLAAAHEAAQSGRSVQAVEALVQAYREAGQIEAERRETFATLQATWERSRYPKGQPVAGKSFYHELDDLKDHWADRRPDLSFMTAPEERIDLAGWQEKLAGVAKAYARRQDIALDAVSFDAP